MDAQSLEYFGEPESHDDILSPWMFCGHNTLTFHLACHPYILKLAVIKNFLWLFALTNWNFLEFLFILINLNLHVNSNVEFNVNIASSYPLDSTDWID